MKFNRSCFGLIVFYIPYYHSESVTRLDGFWKFVVTWFLSKGAKMHGEFFGLSEEHHFPY